MKRLFFALWPEQNARQQCAALISQLNRTGKPINEANLHVTVLFLGRISAEQQAIITREAGKLPTPLITLSFDSLSFWKKPAVICLTSSQFDQSVSTLNENLARIAKQQGIPIENRLFKPHVTLVKKASSAIDFDFAPILWQSIGFCLVESCSGPDGVEYRIIQRWPTI